MDLLPMQVPENSVGALLEFGRLIGSIPEYTLTNAPNGGFLCKITFNGYEFIAPQPHPKKKDAEKAVAANILKQVRVWNIPDSYSSTTAPPFSCSVRIGTDQFTTPYFPHKATAKRYALKMIADFYLAPNNNANNNAPPTSPPTAATQVPAPQPTPPQQPVTPPQPATPLQQQPVSPLQQSTPPQPVTPPQQQPQHVSSPQPTSPQSLPSLEESNSNTTTTTTNTTNNTDIDVAVVDDDSNTNSTTTVTESNTSNNEVNNNESNNDNNNNGSNPAPMSPTTGKIWVMLKNFNQRQLPDIKQTLIGRGNANNYVIMNEEAFNKKLTFAFIHPTFINNNLEYDKAVHSYCNVPEGEYDRLVFLGNSVLCAVVGHVLYSRNPPLCFTDLIRRRENSVKVAGRAECLKKLGLEKHIIARQVGGAPTEKIMSDVFEAVVGVLAAEFSDRANELVWEYVCNLV